MDLGRLFICVVDCVSHSHMWEHRRALPLASKDYDAGVEFEALVSSDSTPLVWEGKAEHLGLKKGLLSRSPSLSSQ